MIMKNISKWSDTHSMGTILNSPLIKTGTDGKESSVMSQLPQYSSIYRERHDSSGDDVFGSETERLHSSDFCDELIDDNYNSFNWKLYKGILYSSMSSVFFSLCSVIVKYLDSNLAIRNGFLPQKSIPYNANSLTGFFNMRGIGEPTNIVLISRSYIGIFLITGFLIASLDCIIIAYMNIHPGELAVFRFVGILALTLPLVIRNGENPFGPKDLRHFLLLRGLAGATSLFLRFCAFRYLPIADASVIIFSVPVFVSIFARIFLKEPCGLSQTLTVCLTMIGLCLTTKLPIIFGSDGEININSQFVNSNTSSVLLNMTMDSTKRDLADIQKLHHLYGVLCALTSTIFASSVFIFIRKAKGAHHSIIMFNFGWVAIIETVIITTLLNGFSMPKTLIEYLLIILLGILSFCGQMFLTQSLQLEQAGPVSVVRAATDIALAFVWQLWLFNEIPDVWSITGAFLVTTAVIVTGLRKWIMTLPEHSLIKTKCNFLTI